MSTIKEIRNPHEYFVISTRTRATHTPNEPNLGREWSDMEFSHNAEYRELLDMGPSGLKEAMKDTMLPPHLKARAASFHGKEHLTAEVFQYKAEEGLIWIPKDRPQDAKRIFNSLKRIDKEISFEPYANALSETELNAPDAPKSLLPKPKK